MSKVTAQETMQLVNQLLEYVTMEALAIAIERSYPSIAVWKAGKRGCSKGDYELMKTMLNRYTRGKK